VKDKGGGQTRRVSKLKGKGEDYQADLQSERQRGRINKQIDRVKFKRKGQLGRVTE
jgi:hypothetical protein